jgi:hypothetical protein
MPRRVGHDRPGGSSVTLPIVATDRIASTHALPRDANSKLERALARDVRQSGVSSNTAGRSPISPAMKSRWGSKPSERTLSSTGRVRRRGIAFRRAHPLEGPALPK